MDAVAKSYYDKITSIALQNNAYIVSQAGKKSIEISIESTKSIEISKERHLSPEKRANYRWGKINVII